LVNKGFIIEGGDIIFLWDQGVNPERARWGSGQDSPILPAHVANHSTGFGSSCQLMELL